VQKVECEHISDSMLTSHINLTRKWKGTEMVSSLRIKTSSRTPASVVTNLLFKINMQNWWQAKCLSLRRPITLLRRGADKSLARPTFRCSRTESIVSLERGVCSCAELQVLSCYRGWKEACQATCAISTTWTKSFNKFFFFHQGKAPKKIHAILKETLRGTCTNVCHPQKLGGPV